MEQMVTRVAFQKKDANPTFKDNVISKSIKFWTKSKYFHVAIQIHGLWYTSLPTKGTFKSSEIEEVNFDIIDIQHSKLETEQYNIMMEYIEAQLGLPYDWKGIILSQVLRFGVNNDDKWFCSEFVSKILQLMYIKEVFDVTPNKVSPETLFNLIKGLDRDLQ